MIREETLSWLDSHINLEATAGKVEGLSLDRMRLLHESMGSPSQKYGTIHVTGTNGKGSTAHLISRLLTNSGFVVGTYSSPHVSSLNERMQMDCVPIEDDVFEKMLFYVQSLESESGQRFSWFEIITAAAFFWFSEIPVDVAVVEVGKLGRYDATNVIDPDVCVVTNIGEDHTDSQKGWQKAVAWEKAGIISGDPFLVIGDMPKSLEEIFLAENPKEAFMLNRDITVSKNEITHGGRILDINTPFANYDDKFLSMNGSYQGDNAALALMTAELVCQEKIGDVMVETAFNGAGLPGRFEILEREPLFIVDGAHNPDGAAESRRALNEFEITGDSYFIFGMTEGKSAEKMLQSFEIEKFQKVICTEFSFARAVDSAELGNAVKKMGVPVDVVPDPQRALSLAWDNAKRGDMVFCAGSLYLTGILRELHLKKQKAKQT